VIPVSRSFAFVSRSALFFITTIYPSYTYGSEEQKHAVLPNFVG